jgi:hypothetical protein
MKPDVFNGAGGGTRIPASASDSAAVLKTAVFAFHHARILKGPTIVQGWNL